MSKTPVLIFGKTGQVAQSLCHFFPEAISIGKDRADFQNPSSVVPVLNEFKPQLVINAAAYTEVDKAEIEPGRAQAINADAPFEIADWCKINGSSLIHYSTDYVYPGTGDSPWLETDRTDPVNRYGRTKLSGEKAILESGCHALILRTSWIFSETGRNFVKTMIKLGSEKKSLSVVNDQIGSPTYAKDIAEATLKISTHTRFQETSGIYNIANGGWTSWHDFAKVIYDALPNYGVDVKLKHLVPIASAQYPTPARRPLNSRLDMRKLRSDFNVDLRPWREALDVCLSAMYK
jgi:dTDP-4-dehydrorhamnose reductase